MEQSFSFPVVPHQVILNRTVLINSWIVIILIKQQTENFPIPARKCWDDHQWRRCSLLNKLLQLCNNLVNRSRENIKLLWSRLLLVKLWRVLSQLFAFICFHKWVTSRERSPGTGLSGHVPSRMSQCPIKELHADEKSYLLRWRGERDKHVSQWSHLRLDSLKIFRVRTELETETREMQDKVL